MKTIRSGKSIFALVVCLSSMSVRGQGTFVYDQQSSDESQLGGGAASIQPNQPLGQSFAPTLSSVGFIRLYLSDDAFNNLGATVYVNLRANSITGTILGSTVPVFVPDRFVGPVNFLFTSDVSVTPEVTYFFQPVIQSGDNFSAYGYNTFNYARGTAFFQSIPSPGQDFWFREGIVVPEPGTWALLLVGLGVLVWQRRKSG